MKFFKQTKETKRKISFFMALAMVISLLPVSPVAKAATTDTSNVYVNIDEKSKTYVELDKVITGGALDSKGATTASVIIAPKSGVTIEKVEMTGNRNVTENTSVTLGSISLKKGTEAVTSASVVVRKASGTGDVSAALSPSSLGNGIIAKASLAATGEAIGQESESITGAVISINGIAGNKDIEVAIVMESGETVTGDVNVDFAGTLEGVVCKAGNENITIGKSITVAKNSSTAIEITPETGKSFVGTPTISATGAEVTGSVADGKYTGTIAVKESDVTVTINAKAAVPSTESEFSVAYTGSIANAVIETSLKSGVKYENGDKVKADDTLDITITPNKGYYFADGKLPKVTLKDKTSATLTETGVTGNAYKASVSSFKKSTVITISGAAEEAKVKNETNSKDNVGAATLDTGSLQAVETDIKNAFKESDKVTAASAAAVTKALADKGTIGVALSVTNAGINKTDAEKGKNAIDSKDKKAKDRAVALDISLTAICRDKDGNEVARVEVNELTKEVKISIAAKGIFGNSFSETPAANCTRKYFVIRVHDGKTEKIECKFVKGNIEFSSKLFSTYVFYYEDVENNQGGNGGGSTGGGSGIGSYVPSGTSTPAPSATPSATPDTSATPDASAAPSTTPSASPSGTAEPGASSKPDATKAPAGNDKDDNTGGSTVKVKVGKKVTVNSSKYKVTSVSGTRAVQFTSGKKNAKNVVIPATVKISGKNYKVTSIANNAFKNNKKLKKVTIGVNVNKIGKAAFKGCKNLKSIIIKTKKLTAKKVGANAFKGINKKATFKVPKKKVKAYKKIVKAKGAAKTVKVKK